MKAQSVPVCLALLGAMLVAGCVGAPPSGGGASFGTQTIAAEVSVAPTVSVPVPNGAAGSPAVLIVDPPFDGGVSSGTVTVSVQVTAFVLVPPGRPNLQGTGHLVYYRDVPPRTMQGESALTAPGTYNTSSETVQIWNGVPSGTHTFAVQLVNADDTPLDPPAIDAVDVTAVSPDMIRAG